MSRHKLRQPSLKTWSVVVMTDAMGEFVQQGELRRSRMPHHDGVRINDCDTEQAPRHGAPHDEWRVDVLTMRNSIDPPLCINQRQALGRMRLLKCVLGARHPLGVRVRQDLCAHASIVARCRFARSSAVKPLV